MAERIAGQDSDRHGRRAARLPAAQHRQPVQPHRKLVQPHRTPVQSPRGGTSPANCLPATGATGHQLHDQAGGHLVGDCVDVPDSWGWQAIYRINRGVIGPDPGRIRAGQHLTLP